MSDTRYARQLLIPEIGEEGQKILDMSKVLVIGAGGLGCACATYLAEAGIGFIEVLDSDTVSLSNLNRQFLYSSEDIGKAKAETARKRLLQMNDGIDILARQKEITARNIHNRIIYYDLVIDCVDSLATRKIVHKACLKKNIPLVEAGIDGFYGFVSCISKGYPCLECMDFFSGREKEQVPALGAVAGVIGSMQAMEAIKILLGMEQTLFGKILYYDGKRQETEIVSIPENPRCKLHKEDEKEDEDDTTEKTFIVYTFR